MPQYKVQMHTILNTNTYCMYLPQSTLGNSDAWTSPHKDVHSEEQWYSMKLQE